MTVIEKLHWRYIQFLKYHFPFFWQKRLYKETCGKVADYSHPLDLNEKIQWLMFYTETSIWTRLADKYAVREFVNERIGSQYLVPLLGKWNNADDIDFDSLPDKFVLKPNNGSYDAIICHDKSKADFNDIRMRLNLSLRRRFGYDTAEIHYLRIPPCIIGEQMLETNEIGGLIDYKIWCFNGKPYAIFLCANRDNVHHTTDFCFYDLQWKKHPEFITASFQNDFDVPCPENLDELLQVATKLSEGLPQVRVDLYDINGHIYFGEMTLSSNFGMMPYFTDDVLKKMGNQFKLPERSCKEKITTFCRRWLPTF